MITQERLRQALVLMAYIVTRRGPVYAPLFERLEREIAAAENSAEARARCLLESYTLEGTQMSIPFATG